VDQGLERPAAMVDCNLCNEALEAARKVLMVARRLAMVVDSAIANGDLARAGTAMRELQDVLADGVTSRTGIAERLDPQSKS
jgi:hypothetical protein